MQAQRLPPPGAHLGKLACSCLTNGTNVCSQPAMMMWPLIWLALYTGARLTRASPPPPPLLLLQLLSPSPSPPFWLALMRGAASVPLVGWARPAASSSRRWLTAVHQTAAAVAAEVEDMRAVVCCR
jgi:hypothetical protein